VTTSHHRFDRSCVVGSGVVGERAFVLPQRARLRVTGPLVAAVRIDPAASGGIALRFRADDNVLPLLRARLVEDVLELGLPPGRYARLKELSVAVTLAALAELESADTARVSLRELKTETLLLRASGASRLCAQGCADEWRVEASEESSLQLSVARTRQLTLSLSHASQARLKGKSDQLSVVARGAARLEAARPEFEARLVRLELRGACRAQVCARESAVGRVRLPSQLSIECGGCVAVDGPYRRVSNAS
jgi:hypothetical protein